MQKSLIQKLSPVILLLASVFSLPGCTQGDAHAKVPNDENPDQPPVSTLAILAEVVCATSRAETDATLTEACDHVHDPRGVLTDTAGDAWRGIDHYVFCNADYSRVDCDVHRMHATPGTKRLSYRGETESGHQFGITRPDGNHWVLTIDGAGDAEVTFADGGGCPAP